MTQKEIREGNSIIAEFMGLPYPGKDVHGNEGYIFSVFYSASKESTNYHKSWDWLMLVIEKIEAFPFTVQISSWGCTIEMWEDSIPREWIDVNFNPIHFWGGQNFINSKLQSTFNAVVEFIKWYNKNKK